MLWIRVLRISQNFALRPIPLGVLLEHRKRVLSRILGRDPQMPGQLWLLPCPLKLRAQSKLCVQSSEDRQLLYSPAEQLACWGIYGCSATSYPGSHCSCLLTHIRSSAFPMKQYHVSGQSARLLHPGDLTQTHPWSEARSRPCALGQLAIMLPYSFGWIRCRADLPHVSILILRCSCTPVAQYLHRSYWN